MSRLPYLVSDFSDKSSNKMALFLCLWARTLLMKVIKIGDCLYLSNRKIPSLDHVGEILRSGRGSVRDWQSILFGAYS